MSNTVAVVHVDPDDGVVATWDAGFSSIRTMRVAVDLGHAEALGVRDLLEQNPAPAPLCAKFSTAAAIDVPSMMLSPRITQIGSPSAKCSARPSASAMPPSPS